MNTYIKDYLNKFGITQKELAERLCVKQATVSATISRPSFPTLERIAAALEVEPWQLLAPSCCCGGAEASQGAALRRWRWWLGGCRACRL